MDIRELLKSLVETEDQMARMQLVEDNAALMETSEPGEATPGADVEALQAEISDLKAKLAAANKKYIDTFFNGGKEPDAPKTEEKPDEGKTLDDLFPR